MKKVYREEIGLALVLIGIVGAIACGIWGLVLNSANPDMTQMRLLIEYPEPSIGIFVSGIVGFVGSKLLR